MRAILTLCAIAAGAGCTNPSARIASELGEYGLDAQRARCVGERLGIVD